jgi:hypothetical protein
MIGGALDLELVDQPRDQGLRVAASVAPPLSYLRKVVAFLRRKGLRKALRVERSIFS